MFIESEENLECLSLPSTLFETRPAGLRARRDSPVSTFHLAVGALGL